MSTTTSTLPERRSYLDAPHGLKAWLLTKDHKRIAMLYLISISIFFAIGGLFAAGIRLELLTPRGDMARRSLMRSPASENTSATQQSRRSPTRQHARAHLCSFRFIGSGIFLPLS